MKHMGNNGQLLNSITKLKIKPIRTSLIGFLFGDVLLWPGIKSVPNPLKNITPSTLAVKGVKPKPYHKRSQRMRPL